MKVKLLAIAAPLLLSAAAPAPDPVPGPESSGTFQAWRAGAGAITYDTASVPAGARAWLGVAKTTDGVRVNLLATGLKPGREYGAHLHTGRCGRDPADAGPHYQHRLDPAAGPGKPSSDPAYANPENEVWLDFTADANGVGRAVSTQDRAFDPARPPWSLVLHSEHTHTAPGTAGTAGARLACLTRDGTLEYRNGPGRG